MRQEQTILSRPFCYVRIRGVAEAGEKSLADLLVAGTVVGHHHKAGYPMIIIMVVRLQVDEKSRFGCSFLPPASTSHEIKHPDHEILVRGLIHKRRSL